MTKVAENIGLYKVNKKSLTTIFSAITAGIFISIAFVFYITVTTGTGGVAWGLAKLVGGICFSMGLMLVVCCGADLFTSTVLTIVPKATKKITWFKMLKNWVLVYIGNFIGAIIFVMVMWFAGQHMAADGLWGLNVLKTADHKLHHTFIEAVFLGILANLMVCLAAWMSYAGRSLLDKMLIMILPVAMFVASGFEHSIANMFMIPMGIVIQNFAGPEFWQAIGISADTYSALTVEHFVFNNLIPVTIGNIIGGLAVGLTYFGLYLRKAH
ncbi:formate transporter FocA [Zophobihabitans entericus]|uniref:Formate transporter FocA n=2 Tax=Zophobihabitans entericus TaxID=1635327 RepID=A0A6G9IFI2_9GAMM|nr:formate transporter FocA [Zophobihabitans entericus]